MRHLFSSVHHYWLSVCDGWLGQPLLNGKKGVGHTVLTAFLFALTAVFVRPVWAITQSYTWGSFDAAGTAVGFYDPNNQPLPQNSIVQFIWVGPDGVINPPDPYTGEPSGDDVLLQTRAIVPNNQVPPPFRNKGYVTLEVYTYDSQDAWAGKKVYLRGWNGTATGRQGDSTAYGDSSLLTLTDGGTGNPLGVQVNREVSAVALLVVQTTAANMRWDGWLISFFVLAILSVYVWRRREHY